jgi:hypothetical protein
MCWQIVVVAASPCPGGIALAHPRNKAAAQRILFAGRQYLLTMPCKHFLTGECLSMPFSSSRVFQPLYYGGRQEEHKPGAQALGRSPRWRLELVCIFPAGVIRCSAFWPPFQSASARTLVATASNVQILHSLQTLRLVERAGVYTRGRERFRGGRTMPHCQRGEGLAMWCRAPNSHAEQAFRSAGRGHCQAATQTRGRSLKKVAP